MDRKKLKDYPQTYFRIVETLERTQTELSTKLTLRSARASRRDLYRFFAAIRESDEEGDQLGRGLFVVSQNLVIVLEPSDGEPTDLVSLIVKFNPLTGMFDDLAEVEPPEPVEVPTEVEPEVEKPSPDNLFGEETSDDSLIDLTSIEDLMTELEQKKGK